VPFSPTLRNERSDDQPGDGQHPADEPTENIATWPLPNDPRSGGYAGISD
jgi:hypothetical protein